MTLCNLCTQLRSSVWNAVQVDISLHWSILLLLYFLESHIELIFKITHFIYGALFLQQQINPKDHRLVWWSAAVLSDVQQLSVVPKICIVQQFESGLTIGKGMKPAEPRGRTEPIHPLCYIFSTCVMLLLALVPTTHGSCNHEVRALDDDLMMTSCVILLYLWHMFEQC